MKVVLDTNVLVVSISQRSTFFLVWQALRKKEFELLVTEDILLEYEEILARLMDEEVAENVIGALELLPNVTLINKYYYWRLINEDPDDNKFVDCAVAGGAEFIVTSDKHFRVLAEIDFPKVKVISPNDFLTLLQDKDL